MFLLFSLSVYIARYAQERVSQLQQKNLEEYLKNMSEASDRKLIFDALDKEKNKFKTK